MMEPGETTTERIKAPGNQAAGHRASASRLAQAMRERDYATLADVLAADVVINSPITAGFQFHGRDRALALLRIVCEATDDMEHYELLGAGDVWTQRFRARVGDRLLEGMDLLRFDEGGHLREMTVFVRPLPGLAAFAAALAPAVGRRRGVVTAIVLRLLTRPLAAMTHHGDRLVAWLLRGTWGAARA